MKLYNTLGRKFQDFEPLAPPEVKIYTCGPTVYDFQHIGNYSGYIYWDVLIRTLQAQGYKVKRVMNVTDVGHLMGDGDEGADKLEKGAAREGKTAREIADFYAEDFMASIKALNLIEPDIYAKATDYIEPQIEMIKTLVKKDFAYQTKQAVYFDIGKLDDYGKLTGQKLSEKEVGARPEVITDKEKRNPQDFGLWFFTVGRFANHQMHWPSPWGEGFPGWHIECSAIIHATLGEPVDIHTGGVDHIGTHHTNEIAQTEAAFDNTLANFWLHNNHMMVEGKKMAKSAGNFFTLKDLTGKGFSPMDFKMLVLSSHYRSQSNFTWEALEAAKNSLATITAWADSSLQPNARKLTDEQEKATLSALKKSLGDDLGTHTALSAIYEAIGKGAPSSSLLAGIDELLGLNLSARKDIDDHLKNTIAEREKAREDKDWQKADELRVQLAEQGIELNDTTNGPVWNRR